MIGGISDTVTLSNGVEMPRLGLGTYKSADGEEVVRAVEAALAEGYRGVDTASFYGNERGVGEGMRRSGIPREDLFIATKVWNDEQGYESTLEALDASLRRLGSDYVDLYLIHWPIQRLMRGTWKAMEEALSSGKTRAIGVCNFLVHHLDELAEIATIPPAVNQFEFHPGLQQPDVVRRCESDGMIVQAWAPLMRGRVCDIPLLQDLGARHGKTPAQIAIRWILQRGITTIPKSVHAERIRENADVFDFELTGDEVARVDMLDTGERLGQDPDYPPS